MTTPYYAPWIGPEDAVASLRALLQIERDGSRRLQAALSRCRSEVSALARQTAVAICEGARSGLEFVPEMSERAAHRLGEAHFELEQLHGLGLGEATRSTLRSAVLLVGEAERLLAQVREAT